MTHPKLLCEVSSISYDVETKVGTLRAPNHNCPDMGGAIEVFTNMNPAVERIDCYEGDRLATIYKRTGDGWQSRLL